jgi:hypothetical protein
MSEKVFERKPFGLVEELFQPFLGRNEEIHRNLNQDT